MRRESKEVQLGSRGEVLVDDDSKRADRRDLCDWYYPVGTAKTNTCKDAAQDTPIDEDSQCEAAARMECPDGGCLGTPFTIGYAYYGKYPSHCFKTEDTPAKFFYNPTGVADFTPTAGVPVCKKKLYINGTKDSNSCGDDAYANVMDEDECRTIQTCLSYCTHEEFRVSDATKMDEVPQGCHIGPDSCVVFNTKTGAPSAPKGSPLCKLKAAHAAATVTTPAAKKAKKDAKTAASI